MKTLTLATLLAALLLVPVAQKAHAQESANSVIFSVGNENAASGNQVTVPVVVTDFTEISSAQFTLVWDSTVLSFNSTDNYGLPGLTAANFGTPSDPNVDDGELTFLWDDPDAMATTVGDGTVIFEVTFDVTGANGTASDVRIADASDDPPVERLVTDQAPSIIPLIADDGSVTVASSPDELVVFSAGFRKVQPNSSVTVPVYVTDFTNINSAGFTLNWDPAVLSFTSTGNYGLPGLGSGNFGTPSETGSDGDLTFGWVDPDDETTTVADSTIIFTVTFQTVGTDGDMTDVFFDDSPSPREVATDPAFPLIFVSDDGGVRVQNEIVSAVQPGDLIVTEFMANPDDVGTNGEYFEVYNDTENDIDLEDYTVGDASGTDFTVNSTSAVTTTTVPAKSFYVLCEDDDSTANGGITNCDYDYPNSTSLDENGDEIIIADASGAEITRVEFDDGDPFGGGVALELAAFADARDDAQTTQADYQAATLNIDGSGTDLGSPGGLGAAVYASGDPGWRLLSAPVAGMTVQDLAAQNLVQGIDDDQPSDGISTYPGFGIPNLYTAYDPGNGCASDEGKPDADADYDCPTGTAAPLGAGEAFFWYLFDEELVPETDALPDSLTSPLSDGPTEDVTVDVSDVADASQDLYLLGNPYDSSFDLEGLNLGTSSGFSTTVQVWDANADPANDQFDDGSYVPITQGDPDDVVSAWQGFFAERTSGSTTTTLTFSEASQVAPATDFIGGSSILPEAQRRVLPLRLTGRDASGAVNAYDEAARLYFHDGALLPGSGPDVWDATKLTPFTSGPFATLAFQQGDALKAQEGLPFELGSAVDVPVAFNRTGAGAGETFTITWPRSAWENIPDGWALTLTDGQTGQAVDLRVDTAYTFAPAPAPGGSDATAGGGQAGRTAAATAGRPLALAKTLAQQRASAESAGSLPPARFLLTVNSGTIPVELTGLSAVSDGPGAVVLSWRTLSETNNAGFEVQQQVDGRFDRIGFVEGAGTTSEPQAYRFRAEDLEPGLHRFRLRQVDTGAGGEQFSGVVEASVLPAERYVLNAPYPNPFAQRSTVEFTVREEHEAITVELYNTLGQRVRVLYKGVVPAGELQTAPIRAGSLSSGLYIVRLRGEGGSQSETVTLVR